MYIRCQIFCTIFKTLNSKSWKHIFKIWGINDILNKFHESIYHCGILHKRIVDFCNLKRNLKVIFLHDRVVTIKSRNFSFAKVWCFFLSLYWSTRGCNLAAHSSFHVSFILRRGLTKFHLPKGFLGLRIIKCRNSSDILEWGPGALKTGNITLIAPNHLPRLDTSRYL